MQCPVDATMLEMNERQGIEIDYCPQCRGVWLDRGELDKIIERANQQLEARPHTAPREASWGDHHGKRRRSFFDDLFD